MRRALVPAAVLTAASALAGAAAAQSAPVNGAGLRYLSWPGKPPAGARPSPAPAPAETAPVVTPASRTLPLARLSPPPAASVETPRRGLTPATAWTAPTPQAYPTAAPVQTYAQPPVQAPIQAPVPQPAPEQVAPRPAPVQTVDVQPSAAEPAQVQVQNQNQTQTQTRAETPPPAADPMAPRRDAPIFRLMRPQAGVAADGAANGGANGAAPAAAPQQAAQLAPGEQTARYYSVHRQAGRHPDAIPAPQPTYLDALPVQMAQTPQSNDLAQPDGPPALIRNANGSLRAAPQTQADDLP